MVTCESHRTLFVNFSSRARRADLELSSLRYFNFVATFYLHSSLLQKVLITGDYLDCAIILDEIFLVSTRE
jgi:hypothetical protein